ncbi:ribosomal protein P0 (A0) (L10E) [Asimina triloba]
MRETIVALPFFIQRAWDPELKKETSILLHAEVSRVRVFSPEVLDLTEDDLIEKFASGVAMVTALSLAISYPTLAAAPHMFVNGYKNVLAVAIATDYSFPQAEKVKEYLQDPSKFAVAAPVAAADTSGSDPAPTKEEEKKEEPAEESDDDMGFSLFD